MKLNLFQQLEAFKTTGKFPNSEGITSNYGFHDCFCDDEEKPARSEALVIILRKFVLTKPDLNLKKSSAKFYNRLPMEGAMYDEVHIESNLGEFTLSRKCTECASGHDSYDGLQDFQKERFFIMEEKCVVCYIESPEEEEPVVKHKCQGCEKDATFNREKFHYCDECNVWGTPCNEDHVRCLVCENRIDKGDYIFECGHETDMCYDCYARPQCQNCDGTYLINGKCNECNPCDEGDEGDDDDKHGRGCAPDWDVRCCCEPNCPQKNTHKQLRVCPMRVSTMVSLLGNDYALYHKALAGDFTYLDQFKFKEADKAKMIQAFKDEHEESDEEGLEHDEVKPYEAYKSHFHDPSITTFRDSYQRGYDDNDTEKFTQAYCKDHFPELKALPELLTGCINWASAWEHFLSLDFVKVDDFFFRKM